jgi:hypothetical protein
MESEQERTYPDLSLETPTFPHGGFSLAPLTKARTGVGRLVTCRPGSQGKVVLILVANRENPAFRTWTYSR